MHLLCPYGEEFLVLWAVDVRNENHLIKRHITFMFFLLMAKIILGMIFGPRLYIRYCVYEY